MERLGDDVVGSAVSSDGERLVDACPAGVDVALRLMQLAHVQEHPGSDDLAPCRLCEGEGLGEQAAGGVQFPLRPTEPSLRVKREGNCLERSALAAESEALIQQDPRSRVTSLDSCQRPKENE